MNSYRATVVAVALATVGCAAHSHRAEAPDTCQLHVEETADTCLKVVVDAGSCQGGYNVPAEKEWLESRYPEYTLSRHFLITPFKENYRPADQPENLRVLSTSEIITADGETVTVCFDISELEW